MLIGQSVVTFIKKKYKIIIEIKKSGLSENYKAHDMLLFFKRSEIAKTTSVFYLPAVKNI